MMNQLKQIIINQNVFYVNDNSELFYIKNQTLDYFGYVDKDKNICVREHNTKDKFSHKDYFEKNKLDNGKLTVLYFLKDSQISYHTKFFCEFLSKKFNVIVLGDRLWNVFINNVMYVKVNTTNTKYIVTLPIHSIFTEDLRFFVYFSKDQFENTNISYIHHKLSLNPDEIYFNKNFMHNIHKFIFFNSDELRYFKLYYDFSDQYVEEKFHISKYLISSLKFKKQQDSNITADTISNQRKKIVCFDKHEIDAMYLLDKLNKKNNSKFELILFNESSLKTNVIENVVNLPRYMNNFIHSLAEAAIFFTSEIENYTHFNLTIAMGCNIKCVIPKYYHSLKKSDLCITFDKIDDVVDEIIDAI